MGPAVVMRGRQEAIDYYRILLAELQERVSQGVAAVEREKHRFYWEGMPVWGKLRMMSELFARLKSCIVVSTYCNSWAFSDFDPMEPLLSVARVDPFLSMARAYTSIFNSQDDAFKENYITDNVKHFKVDGIIYHDAKTCPNNSNTRYATPNRLAKRLGIPYLIINGDLNDLRCFSEEQTITNIEAFVEQLDESK
jgi:benzoyl-CoA reductase/2-hydroxyglutaryl-CoA dehydratase subunit BcrC/BadD/HgdB